MVSIPLLNSKPLKENDQEEQQNHFKHWLALRSCTKYWNGLGYIDSYRQPKKVDFMFNKKIKLLIYNIWTIHTRNTISISEDTILITEDGERYDWRNEIYDNIALEVENEDEFEEQIFSENEDEASEANNEVEVENEDEFEEQILSEIEDEASEANNEIEVENENEFEEQILSETEDEIGEANNEVENEAEDDTEDEDEDEDKNNTELIKNYRQNSSCISYYSQKLDWSNTRVIKTATSFAHSFLVLTDDGKIYYATYDEGMYQINIKTKITCIGCGFNFCTIITDNGKTYSWSSNPFIQLGNSKLKFTDDYLQELREVELSGKTIVKVVCGSYHTLALTDKGKVYGWGCNTYKQLHHKKKAKTLSPTMINRGKASDIAAIDCTSAICSTDGLVYIWGSLANFPLKKPIICEYTNIFDVCNSKTGQSPISTVRTYTDEEYSLLNDFKAAFNDRSTSDLTIEVDEQPIYVHKAVLKIRSLYFRTMFQSNYAENKQSVIKHCHYSYVTFKTFLEYLYTGTINLSSIQDLLELLQLADEYLEYNLERDCTKIIRKGITVSNIIHINETAIEYNKMELQKYCFDFFLKNKTDVMQSESFAKLAIDKKIMFITKANNFFTSSF